MGTAQELFGHKYNAWIASRIGVFHVQKNGLLMVSQKCHMVTGCDPGGVTAAVAEVADTRSTAGCSPALQSRKLFLSGMYTSSHRDHDV